jgi:hypothetical protein
MRLHGQFQGETNCKFITSERRSYVFAVLSTCVCVCVCVCAGARAYV